MMVREQTFCIFFLQISIIEPILDDRFKEKIMKPGKGVLCSQFCVCVSVCTRATEHTL